MLDELIRQIREGMDLDEAQAESALRAILSDDVEDSVIASFLLALAEKGESDGEITGFARVMRDLAVRIRSSREAVVDTAGTGGGRPSFNISTAAALVASGAGVAVAKHGNRAITSRSGSADVLQELGVKIDCPASVSEKALEELGICFLFAPAYHPAMKRVARIRRELGRKTIFNMLGPLTNPASAPYQVVGVYAPELTEKLAGALLKLGCQRAWVVHGLDGLDELSISAPSLVCRVENGECSSFEFKPVLARLAVPEGGTPEENALLIRGLLDGSVTGPARDVVKLNAAVTVHVATGFPLSRATEMVEESLHAGAARRKLEELVEFYSS
jgi:anthranilate phosphoribosyltransferase